MIFLPDTIIAAHALTLGATLVPRNRAEFSRIPALTVENWRRTEWEGGKKSQVETNGIRRPHGPNHMSLSLTCSAPTFRAQTVEL